MTFSWDVDWGLDTREQIFPRGGESPHPWNQRRPHELISDRCEWGWNHFAFDHTVKTTPWSTLTTLKSETTDQPWNNRRLHELIKVKEDARIVSHHTGYSNLVSTVVAFRPESESVWFNIEKRIAVLWGNQNAFSCGTDYHPFFDLGKKFRNTDQCLYKQLLCVFHVPCLNWWDLPKLSNFSSFQQNAEHFPWQEAGRGQLGAFLRLSWVGRSKQEDQGTLDFLTVKPSLTRSREGDELWYFAINATCRRRLLWLNGQNHRSEITPESPCN